MTYDHDIIQDKIIELSELCKKNYNIDQSLYRKYDVKRGLRDLEGKGVLAGLTDISEIIAFKKNPETGESEPCIGELYYRGYDVKKLVDGFYKEKRFGFEETIYLLLFGELPTPPVLEDFKVLLSDYRKLPRHFVRDVIMNYSSTDMMNSLAKSTLALYSEDILPDDIRIENVLRQCLELIAIFPLMSIYAYQIYRYERKGKSLVIHYPKPHLSTAENILRILRPDSQYTELEARILDIALVLHAEHGGGNNSTFTTHVVSSSGTDTYSAIAGALGSLKGPKHGGANIKVTGMFADMQKNITDWEDEDAVRDYLFKLLRKEAFDNMGLIYGMGHAIYSISDPRCDIFKDFTKQLCIEKGREREFALYSLVERLAPEVIAQERRIYKGVSANVDFYSGFVYSMLDLPPELYTPIFAISRIVGWSAHRIEELINSSKIIRPAYMAVAERKDYVPLSER